MDIRRHRELFNPRQDARPVIVAGCGATGSHIALQLLSYGIPDLAVVDFDTVAEHNIPNQAFDERQVGMTKVDAFQEIARRKFFESQVTCINGRLPEVFPKRELPENTVLILAVDSMKAREEIVDAIPDSWHVIDTRMGATHGNVISFEASRRELWKKTLIRDDEAEGSVCGTEITAISTVFFIAGLAVTEYIKLCTDPDACEEHIKFFLKPLAVNTCKL